MKTYLTRFAFGLAGLTLMSACATSDQFAQTSEYDDLYFTASDRNTVEFTKLNDPKKADYQQGSYVFDQQSYSSKNVNPEYIAKYNAGNQLNQEESVAQNEEYYVEEFEREDYMPSGNQPQVVNNFYGPASTFGNPAFGGGWGASPFFDPFLMDPFYDPFWGPSAFAGAGWGWRPGFSMGISMGFGWGRPVWGFGNAWAYRPWRDPFFSPWGFRNGYAMGFNDGFYGSYWNRPGVVIINNNENLGVNRRLVTNGRNIQRVSRATTPRSNATVRGRSVADRNAAVTRGTTNRTNARTSSNRDFTRSQNEYYQRSRANARSAESSRVYRSTTPASRSSRSFSTTEAARSSRSSTYTRSRSTSPSRSSYGTNSRSGSYSRGSYGNTRSSSPSYNSGSRSRSSGSYGGSSSGSYSRGSSSGSSSGGSRGSRGGGGE